MRSRSPAGSSTPTSKRTKFVLVAILIPVAFVYVVEALTAPSPPLRVVLRCAPVLPVAIWLLWFDRSRPFKARPFPVQQGGRIALLLLIMAFAVALLGIGLNWIYDPNRVI